MAISNVSQQNSYSLSEYRSMIRQAKSTFNLSLVGQFLLLFRQKEVEKTVQSEAEITPNKIIPDPESLHSKRAQIHRTFRSIGSEYRIAWTNKRRFSPRGMLV